MLTEMGTKPRENPIANVPGGARAVLGGSAALTVTEALASWAIEAQLAMSVKS